MSPTCMSQPTLVNSIVWGNSPEQIYFDTDWWGEAVTIEYSDIAFRHRPAMNGGVR